MTAVASGSQWFLLIAASGVLWCCSGQQTYEHEMASAARSAAGSNANAPDAQSINATDSLRTEPMGEYSVGGIRDGEARVTREIPREGAAEGQGNGIAVYSDAGVASAELAWLVAHIADAPDRNNPTDGPNVRALASRGAEGVRAVVPLFRRGDSVRVPFARRLVERVAVRSCRVSGREAAQRLIVWIELGPPLDRPLNDAGLLVWTRPDNQAWPERAMARLVSWAESGAPCDPIRAQPPADAGTLRDAAADTLDAFVMTP